MSGIKLTLSVQGWSVNIFSFVGHTISVTIYFCWCCAEATTDGISLNGDGFVSVTLLSQTLEFEFHIIFPNHKMFLFSQLCFNQVKCKNYSQLAQAYTSIHKNTGPVRFGLWPIVCQLLIHIKLYLIFIPCADVMIQNYFLFCLYRREFITPPGIF